MLLRGRGAADEDEGRDGGVGYIDPRPCPTTEAIARAGIGANLPLDER
jgi:hypothetical protein